jgi:hypothetical protein
MTDGPAAQVNQNVTDDIRRLTSDSQAWTSSAAFTRAVASAAYPLNMPACCLYRLA